MARIRPGRRNRASEGGRQYYRYSSNSCRTESVCPAGRFEDFKSRFGGASQSHPPEWRHHASVHEFEVEVSRAGPDKMEEGGRGRRTR